MEKQVATDIFMKYISEIQLAKQEIVHKVLDYTAPGKYKDIVELCDRIFSKIDANAKITAGKILEMIDAEFLAKIQREKELMNFIRNQQEIVFTRTQTEFIYKIFQKTIYFDRKLFLRECVRIRLEQDRYKLTQYLRRYWNKIKRMNLELGKNMPKQFD